MYPIFSLESRRPVAGATPTRIKIAGGTVEITALLVGEEGRGRSRGVLPVDRAPVVHCPERGQKQWYGSPCSRCGVDCQGEQPHPQAGTVLAPVLWARVTETRSGKPKLIAAPAPHPEEALAPAEACVLVCRTEIANRGSSAHTGDWTGRWKPGSSWGSNGPEFLWAPRPGQVLTEGMIAQGAAGRAGSGSQYVFLLPAGQVLRIRTCGEAWYYCFDGVTLHAANGRTEREMLPDDHPLAWPVPSPEPEDEVRAPQHVTTDWIDRVIQCWGRTESGRWEKGSKGTLLSRSGRELTLDEGWETGDKHPVTRRPVVVQVTTDKPTGPTGPLDLQESAEDPADDEETLRRLHFEATGKTPTGPLSKGGLERKRLLEDLVLAQKRAQEILDAPWAHCLPAFESEWETDDATPGSRADLTRLVIADGRDGKFGGDYESPLRQESIPWHKVLTPDLRAAAEKAQARLAAAETAAVEAQALHARVLAGEILVNWGGSVRLMGRSGNCGMWVIPPEGIPECDLESLLITKFGRAPDYFRQRKSYPEGTVRWNRVEPDELALAWRKGCTADEHCFQVAKLPVGGCTPAQVEAARNIEQTVAGWWEGATGMASGKSDPGIGAGFGLSSVPVDPDSPMVRALRKAGL